MLTCGPVHHARFMAKAIYIIKMFIVQVPAELMTPHKQQAVRRTVATPDVTVRIESVLDGVDDWGIHGSGSDHSIPQAPGS